MSEAMHRFSATEREMYLQLMSKPELLSKRERAFLMKLARCREISAREGLLLHRIARRVMPEKYARVNIAEYRSLVRSSHSPHEGEQ